MIVSDENATNSGKIYALRSCRITLQLGHKAEIKSETSREIRTSPLPDGPRVNFRAPPAIRIGEDSVPC